MGSAARNIWETKLFIKYVLRSEELAVRFSQDALADIRDVLKSFKELGIDARSDQFRLLIDQLKKELAGFMDLTGTPSDLSYLKCSKIAETVQLEKEYGRVYQFLSKFSHASSLVVLTRDDDWKTFIAPLLASEGFFQFRDVFALISNAAAEKQA
jgi:hypothetical protein